jgi:DNA-binding NarL/FixJ family response regulator
VAQGAVTSVPAPRTAETLADPFRLLVVHAQETFGEALARRLGREEDLEVLGTVSRTLRALVLVPARSVGTVVLDWDLPDRAAEQLAGQLQALDRPPVLVALGDDDTAAAVVGALRAGVRAWVPKSSGVDELLLALRRTAAGEMWLPGRLIGRVVGHALAQGGTAPPSPLDALTERELDVLRCMTAGLGQADIAARLYLSPNTVRTHRRRTLAKLGVHSSLEAVFVARRAGLTADTPPC